MVSRESLAASCPCRFSRKTGTNSSLLARDAEAEAARRVCVRGPGDSIGRAAADGFRAAVRERDEPFGDYGPSTFKG